MRIFEKFGAYLFAIAAIPTASLSSPTLVTAPSLAISVAEEKFFRLDCVESGATSLPERFKVIGKARLSSNLSVSYPYVFDRHWRVLDAHVETVTRNGSGGLTVTDYQLFDGDLREYKVYAHGYYQALSARASNGVTIGLSSESGYGAADDRFSIDGASHVGQNCKFEML